jgi:hypothetical protein
VLRSLHSLRVILSNPPQIIMVVLPMISGMGGTLGTVVGVKLVTLPLSTCPNKIGIPLQLNKCLTRFNGSQFPLLAFK